MPAEGRLGDSLKDRVLRWRRCSAFLPDCRQNRDCTRACFVRADVVRAVDYPPDVLAVILTVYNEPLPVSNVMHGFAKPERPDSGFGTGDGCHHSALLYHFRHDVHSHRLPRYCRKRGSPSLCRLGARSAERRQRERTDTAHGQTFLAFVPSATDRTGQGTGSAESLLCIEHLGGTCSPAPDHDGVPVGSPVLLHRGTESTTVLPEAANLTEKEVISIG